MTHEKGKEIMRAVAQLTGLSRVDHRALHTSTQMALDPPEQISFQHTVLCQTSLPYRNQGDAARTWERRQGAVALRIEAGAARHPMMDQRAHLRRNIRLCITLCQTRSCMGIEKEPGPQSCILLSLKMTIKPVR